MAAPTHTDDQLRAAWRERRRANWPDTFEAAMNDPFYSRIVLIEANTRARRACSQAAANAPHHHPPRRPLPVLPSLPPVLDHKRRAAGERDDD